MGSDPDMIQAVRQEWALLLGVVTLISLQTSPLLPWLMHQQAALVLGGLVCSVFWCCCCPDG